MLVLSRKIGERIVLPESGISVVVLRVSGKRVRLGIEAPSGAAVHREEVWERILDLAGPNPRDPSIERPGCECLTP